MPPDSPNPSPTQEVETFTIFRCTGCGTVPPDDCECVESVVSHDVQIQAIALEDHQRLLQAAKDELDEAHSAASHWLGVAQAAESKLSSVVEELERQKDASETLHDYAIKCDDDLTQAYQTGALAAYEHAIQLLRDKGKDGQ
jgi:hypothetical protein